MMPDADLCCRQGAYMGAGNVRAGMDAACPRAVAISQRTPWEESPGTS